MNVNIDISLPKNRFEIFTVNREGKRTGKSIADTNIWTNWGLNRMVSTDSTGAYSGVTYNSTTARRGLVDIVISESNVPIDSSFTSFNTSEFWTSKSDTVVATREGIKYDSVVGETIGDVEYWRFRHMRSWPFGSVNRTINSVAITNTSGTATSNILAGKNVNFSVDEDEQLLVRYDILIPKKLFSIGNSEGGTFSTKTTFVGDQEITASFKRSPFRLSDNPDSYTSYINMGTFALLYPNSNKWSIRHSGGNYIVTGSRSTVSTNTQYNRIIIDPYPSGNATINALYSTNSNDSTSPHYMRVHFSPGIIKSEDERVIIDFTTTFSVSQYEI